MLFKEVKKMKKHKFSLVILMVLLTLVVLPNGAFSQMKEYQTFPSGNMPEMGYRPFSYGDMDGYLQEMTISEFIMGTDDLSILAGALKAAGLEGILGESGPFTVFAPMNVAFRKLLPEAADYILTCSPGKLETFLKSHVVSGRIESESLVPGETFTSVSGKELSVERRWFNPVVEGAGISGNPLVFNNGILYMTDRVIPDEKIAEIEKAHRESLRERTIREADDTSGGFAPMSYAGAEDMNVIEYLSNQSAVSIFFGAIKSSGMDYEISQNDNITVFAPINQAFGELSPEKAEYLMTCDKKDLIEILRSHFVEGSLSEVDLRETDSLTDLNGQKLNLTMNWFSTSIEGATIRSYEVVTSNGVIHLVDKVIMPSEDK